MRARLVLFALSLSTALACGGSSKRADRPKPLDEWRTEQEWVFVSPERCVTGPFEIEVPAREIEFGRRFVVEVFGARGLPFDSRMTYENGATSSGWGWFEEGLGDHSACRADEEELAESPAAGGGFGGDASTGGGGSAGGSAASGGMARHEVDVPELAIHRGELPEPRRQGSAIAWYPRGNPNYFAIDDIRSRYYSKGGEQAFRFAFWFHRPVDMEGVVFRIRDQVLVPTGSLDAYRASFDARVAEVDRRKRAEEGEEEEEEKRRDPARGKVPPPPRKEAVPEAPGPDVDWLPGYWRYHADLEDFLWVSGTFVVREAEVAEGDARGDAAEASAEVAVADELEEPEVRAIEEQVPPPPAPRSEAIPPPPAAAGAQWVPGHWQLTGKTWTWVAGRWQVPAARGSRFRAPSIEVRGDVKVYVPGGWTLRRR